MNKSDTKVQHEPSDRDTDQTPLVLVVDDEPLVLRVCRRILERAGYRVVVVEYPENAAQVVREHDGSVRVLVCDIQMPGVSGGELAAQLCELQPSLKVIFISGHASAKEASCRFDEQIAGFLSKPFASEELLALVSEALAA